MKQGHYYLLLTLLLVSGCATTPRESVQAPFDSSAWHVAYSQKVEGYGSIVERLPPGQTLENWTAMFTIQSFAAEKRSVQEFLDGLKGEMFKTCPSAMWSTIDQDQTSVLYEWHFDNCKGQPPQHEISRLLKGKDGMHRVSYVEKVTILPASTRTSWIQALRSAYVVEHGKDPVGGTD